MKLFIDIIEAMLYLTIIIVLVVALKRSKEK